MSNYGIDFDKLSNKLLNKTYKYSEVKDRLVKVAFDIVRFKDGDNAAALWQVQSSDDGDFIVSLYDDSETVKTASLPWEAVLLHQNKSLEIFYKGDSLVRIATSKLGLSDQDLDQVESYLPRKLAENKKLAKALLSELDETTKKMVLNKYPELG